MHSLHLDYEELTSALNRIMRQPYVEKYIKKPFFDSDKLMFLTDMYQHTDVTDEERKQIIMTVMLVQCAVDTHELVPVRNDASMSETEKQLSVLAGDYYSGLYYALLAEHGQIRMIQVLASAIKKINEYKMNLYYEDAMDFDELIYFLMKMESLLIVDVANELQIDQMYIRVVEKVCLLNRLNKDFAAVENNENTYLTVFLHKSIHEATDTQLLQWIETEINKQAIELDHLLSLLPSSFDVIQAAVRGKFALSYHATIAEEG